MPTTLQRARCITVAAGGGQNLPRRYLSLRIHGETADADREAPSSRLARVPSWVLPDPSAREFAPVIFSEQGLPQAFR